MDRVFFEQLCLPEVKYNLDVGSGTHGEQTGRMLIGVEPILRKEQPSVVLVEGDTNTVLAGALAAAKLGFKVGHVEAGLRSYDRQMPEELNRVLVDHCSDLLFAPTQESKKTLLNEGVSSGKIFVTGNTIVDAVNQNLGISKKDCGVFDSLGVKKGDYFVATVHRQENVDDEKRFRDIVEGLRTVHEAFGFPVVYPIHPRAKKQLDAFNVKADGIEVVDPLDYLSFLQLESSARLVLTDSGGVQEEACALGVPCVTLRYSTERPETLKAGSNVLAGTEPGEIKEKVGLMLSRGNSWENPFGDGKAGERIVRVLEEYLD